jgi:hypothetical protein
MISNKHAALAHQSRGRVFTQAEMDLAAAIERIYATGEHNYEKVAAALEQEKVARPSGSVGPWTAAVLDAELKQINQSLDEAYAKHGIGA